MSDDEGDDDYTVPIEVSRRFASFPSARRKRSRRRLNRRTVCGAECYMKAAIDEPYPFNLPVYLTWKKEKMKMDQVGGIQRRSHPHVSPLIYCIIPRSILGPTVDFTEVSESSGEEEYLPCHWLRATGKSYLFSDESASSSSEQESPPSEKRTERTVLSDDAVPIFSSQTSRLSLKSIPEEPQEQTSAGNKNKEENLRM